jgi:hypothetical protein
MADETIEIPKAHLRSLIQVFCSPCNQWKYGCKSCTMAQYRGIIIKDETPDTHEGVSRSEG